jgi:hypothetical protein
MENQLAASPIEGEEPRPASQFVADVLHESEKTILTRARIRAPFDGEIISPKTQDKPTPLTM